jgi:plasmid stabilization system protein ParE
MRVRYTLLAEHDIQAISNYLKTGSPGGAKTVLAAIRSAVAYIGYNPLGSPNTNEPDVYVKVVTGRPYRIFYRIHDDAVEFLHVRHISRARTEGWK